MPVVTVPVTVAICRSTPPASNMSLVDVHALPYPSSRANLSPRCPNASTQSTCVVFLMKVRPMTGWREPSRHRLDGIRSVAPTNGTTLSGTEDGLLNPGHGTQQPLGATQCRFDPGLRHQSRLFAESWLSSGCVADRVLRSVPPYCAALSTALSTRSTRPPAAAGSRCQGGKSAASTRPVHCGAVERSRGTYASSVRSGSLSGVPCDGL